MERIVDKSILNEWMKGKLYPENEIAHKALIAPETARKILKGHVPSRTVRVKVAAVIGVDELQLFPFVDDVAA